MHTIKKADNEHAKSYCALPNQYKVMLCTTKVYVGIELHREPLLTRSLSTTKVLYLYTAVLVHHLCMFIVILPGKSDLEHHTGKRSYLLSQYTKMQLDIGNEPTM